MIVKLKRKNSKYPDLTPRQPYLVIGIEADDLRLINDVGRPYLYPAHIFRCIDASEPHDWISEDGQNGERYAYPRALNRPGFFEDFFDHKRRAVTTFWQVVNQRLAAGKTARKVVA